MEEESEFERFQETHGKQYKDSAEHAMRFGFWKDNLHYVRKWNGDSSKGFQLGMNEFADISDKEFANTYLNPKMHEEYMESEVSVLCVCHAPALSHACPSWSCCN
jgi:hypothetical protein